jgi:DNA-binding transcriptional LysR family regulator
MGSHQADLDSLSVFVAVARAKGFREAARATGSSASGMSEAVRRLEAQLGVRLLHRTTRSVALTEAGQRLLERLGPALSEVNAALDALNSFRDTPAGTLRLNVPLAAARLVLPDIVPAFIAAHPDIKLEIIVEERLVDLVEEGCDAGIRYGERLEQDMIAVPIGPREQGFATAASPAYLAKHGRPRHPRDLLKHACLRGRIANGSPHAWEFERDGEVVTVDPSGPLLISLSASELAVHAAIADVGIITTFEGWLVPHFKSGALEPVLKSWWLKFPGPFLYYPGRRLVPGPLRAFINFIQKRR